MTDDTHPIVEVQQAWADQQKAKMSITGASYLASQVRARIAAAKQRMTDAGVRVDTALDEVEKSAAQVVEVAKVMEKEAADLVSSMAAITNGPPADEGNTNG